MQTYYISVIRDLKANDATGPALTHKHQQAAIRDFLDIVADDRTAINKHPEDYELIVVAKVTFHVHEDGDFMHTEKLHTVLITGAAAQEVIDQQKANRANKEQYIMEQLNNA